MTKPQGNRSNSDSARAASTPAAGEGSIANSTAEKSPSGTTFSSGSSLERVNVILDNAVQDSILNGAVLVASHSANIIARVVRGSKLPGGNDMGSALSPLQADTVFDLNGLTSTICTATLLMRLISAGKVDVNERASRYLQTLGIGQKSLITIAHLLSHTSGFPVANSIYDELIHANAGPRPGILTSAGAKQFAFNHFVKIPLRYDPGTKHVPSDINSILLGHICEIVTGLPLDRAFHKYVAAPLQLKSLSFIDLTLLRRKSLEPVVEMFAPSGECPKRGKIIAGQVWDETACVMGGVAGHAGLFGIVSDVHAWAVEIVKAWHGQSDLISQEVMRSFWNPVIPGQKLPLKLGFDFSSREEGFVDQKIAPDSGVAAGSTGSSVFIDPLREVVVVLLTNAGYSDHMSRRFPGVRSEIHSAVLESL